MSSSSSLSSRRRSTPTVSSSASTTPTTPSSVPPKDATRLRIEKMEADREARRRAMQERKQQRMQADKANRAAGNPGDVDFMAMVEQWRRENTPIEPPLLDDGGEPEGLTICVRKRPLAEKERQKEDHDCISIFHPRVHIHAAKLKVDGITKYLDHSSFQFDYAFDENTDTYQVYQYAARPLLDFCTSGVGGRATIFAYGQTGSGKTYTMSGIQDYMIHDLYQLLDDDDINQEGYCTHDTCKVVVSFFELYGGSIQDLLNERQRLKVLEDGKGEINVTGLTEREAEDPHELQALLRAGHDARTTHMTEANDTSSRSHAICHISLRDRETDKLRGKLSLVDLAGSERGSDTKSHNAQRRTESADINTSLLSLKECIRALNQDDRVPYRGSKLTLLLKDCFTSRRKAMTTMIATVSPGASSADHTLNTLRYANRIKEQKVRSGSSSSVVSMGSTNSANWGTRSSRSEVGTRSTQTRQRAASQPPPVRRTGNLAGAPTSSSNPSFSNTNSSSLRSTRMEGGSMTKGASVQSSFVEEEDFEDDDDDDDDVWHSVRPARSIEERRSGGRRSRSMTRHPSPEVDRRSRQQTEELELRATVDNLVDQEEEILSLHMRVIQENAELLSEEGELLRHIQSSALTRAEVDEYMDALEIVLDRKEELILGLQDKLGLFRQGLQREQDLSDRVYAH